jgi:signal transduction histidine kinase
MLRPSIARNWVLARGPATPVEAGRPTCACSMVSTPRTSPFDLSLEALRRDHPVEYRRWVLAGVLTSLIGYVTSCLVFAHQHGWRDVLTLADPFVALVDLVALALLYRNHMRAAASLALAGTWADVHVSLLTLHLPQLTVTGLVVPVFVLAAGLLFGGRVAFVAAGALSVSVPTTLWLASTLKLGSGLGEPSMVYFVVVVEAVLLATTALLAAFLSSFAKILKQHEDSEAKRRELQAQLQHAQKLEALGLLAGGIAHDFNNLLTAIGGYGALLENSTDPRARAFGTEIVGTQRRGAALTRQLLAFARKDISQPEPMDLGSALGKMTGLLERAVGARVRLQLDCEPECTIVADRGRIEQVVLNLAVNARDAMPDGGMLWIRCEKTATEVRLEVADEGVGMDEATKSRLFEPFFTTKPRDQGTGLGLATVHGIVADSNGRIEVDSKLGRGTRFTLHWPRSVLAPAAEDALPVQLSGAQRLVLLVEDNDGARSFVQRLLLNRGFRVEAARSADEALERVAGSASAPDLVLCDVIMPGRSGPELVAQLKSRWPGLRCLFMSGYLGDVALGDGFDQTADLVAKPFTSAELLARIARKLEGDARR